MLYFDASALVKCYSIEDGTEAMIARLSNPHETLFTSVLSYAEVHGALARKYRDKEMSSREYADIRTVFEKDWQTLLNVVELDLRIMAVLPQLVARYPLKAGDAIHLSSAIWLRDHVVPANEILELAVIDRRLAKCAAEERRLRIFNPIL